MRHRRHHPPHRQAQLPGQGRARSGGDDEKSLSHRTHRPPRSGGDRYSQGRVLQEDRLDGLSAERGNALLQPGQERPQRPDPQGIATAAERQAPLYLHGRRRAAGQCLQRAAHPGRHAGHARDPHPDGPGRLSRERAQVPGHAGHARHHRSQQRDAELRRAAGPGCAL
ncbi:hypothetical protein D3C79_833870 [compost metagenome]